MKKYPKHPDSEASKESFFKKDEIEQIIKKTRKQTRRQGEKLINEGFSDYLDEKQEREQERIKENLKSLLEHGDIDFIYYNFTDFKPFFNDVDIQEAAKHGMVSRLKEGYIADAQELRTALNVPDDFWYGPEMLEAAKHGMVSRLKDGYIADAQELRTALNVPDDFWYGPEMLEAAKQGMIYSLKNGSLDYSQQIRTAFNVPTDSPEVLEAARQRMIDCLTSTLTYSSYTYIDDVQKIRTAFNVPDSVVLEAARQGMILSLSNGRLDVVEEIKEFFSIPDDFFHGSEMLEAAKQGMIYSLKNGSLDYSQQIRTAFNVPTDSPEVLEAAKQGMVSRLKNGYLNDTQQIRTSFNVPDDFWYGPEMLEAAKQGMIYSLKNGYLNDTQQIRTAFNVPTDSPEVLEAAKQRMVSRLKNGYLDDAQEIRTAFRLGSLVDVLLQEPKIQSFLGKIQAPFPLLHERISKSEELLISMLQMGDPDSVFDQINQNPFLADAITQNPRFAPRLILQYPEFDDLSKSNIRFLLNAKKAILAAHPDWDPESVEFRMAMQEKLKAHGRNAEILKTIQDAGLKTEAWLNYDETAYFNLEKSGAVMAFSEQVGLPLNRIQETLDSYAYQIKTVLGQYREELSAYQMELQDTGAASELGQQLNQMKKALDEAQKQGNTKKSEGIQKGIDTLTSKKNQEVRKVALWQKLMGDIQAWQQLKTDVVKAKETLTESENNLFESLAGKKVEIQSVRKFKDQLEKSKRELRAKTQMLEVRLEEFKEGLLRLLAPALTRPRAEALIQEITEATAEQFSHYDTDRSTLANLFSGQIDKLQEGMEHRPMSIFVWARNPDIDLYQGNYSPCCISIESGRAGESSESTISDYATDLGIQIVNIWDEEKNMPVTAAWCWIGQDEDGKPALVVDNIESNTAYSTAYPEQLTQELFDYIIAYAKKIGVSKVVLGKAHNDLPRGSVQINMKSDDYKYSKIGDYNRNEGYYLEAQHYGVNVVWDSQANPQKAPKAAQKQEQIKLKNIQVNPLTAEDHEAIMVLESRVYEDDLQQGHELIEDIQNKKGHDYSLALYGTNDKGEKQLGGYAVVVEDETDEGEPSVYLEDIAIAPEVQGQGYGWELMKSLFLKLQEKANRTGTPIIFDMHLREGSQRLLERHHEDIQGLGIDMREEAMVPDYYDEGEDALYRVYEVKPARMAVYS